MYTTQYVRLQYTDFHETHSSTTVHQHISGTYTNWLRTVERTDELHTLGEHIVTANRIVAYSHRCDDDDDDDDDYDDYDDDYDDTDIQRTPR
jgi:hypothetical protein